MDPVIIAFIFVFIGVFCRTILPYLRKRKEAGDKGLKFDIDYAYTCLFTLFISAVVTMLIFPSLTIPEEATIYVATTSFAFGWTANDLINEIIA